MQFLPITFCIITDTHNTNRAAALGRYYQQVLSIYNGEPAGSPSKLRDALEQAATSNCDFLVHLGDINEFESSDHDATLANLTDIIDFIDTESGTERHVVLGNHDFPYVTRADWLAVTGKTGPGGTAYYSFLKGVFHFVIMDFNYDVNGNVYPDTWLDTRKYYFPTAERNWLVNELKANEEKTTFIFTHQKASTFGEKLGAAELCLEQADGNAFREICESYGRVVAVFNGHTHKSDYNFINGIHYFTLQAAVEDDGDVSPVDGVYDEDASQNAYAIISIGVAGICTVTPYANVDDQNKWSTISFRVGGNMSRQIKITVDNTKVSTTLTDFPVLITEANLPQDFWDHVQTDGSDVWVQGEVANEMTLWDSELNYIDVASKKLELWVKVPSLSSSVDTVFFLNYGDTSLVVAKDATTWDSNFVTVHHMTDLNFLDSTANGHDGTEGSAVVSGDIVDGPFGKATNFLTSVNDYVNLGTSVEFDFGSGAFTFECLFKPVGFNANAHYQQLISVGQGFTAADGTLAFSPNDKASFKANGWTDSIALSPVLSTTKWYHLVGSREAGGNLHLYLDGVEVTSGTPSNTGIVGNGDSSKCQIGAYHNGDTFAANAIIAEVRVSNLERSINWAITSYNNMLVTSLFYKAEVWQIPYSEQEVGGANASITIH